MAGDPQLERRVTRLENDRDAMYDLLTDIGSTLQEHSRKFDGIDRRLDGIDRRLDGIDRRLDTHDRRFDAMDSRFDSIDATLAEVVRRLPEPS